MLGGVEPAPEPEPEPSPDPVDEYPYYAVYAGNTYVNLRDEPSGEVIGRVSAGDRVVVLQNEVWPTTEWVEVIVLHEKPELGWCVSTWLRKE